MNSEILCNTSARVCLSLNRDEPWHLTKLGVGEGQGSLACCSPWGRKESDTTKQLS